MIKTKKRPSIPPTLLSQDVARLKESLRQRVRQGQKLRSIDFTPYWSKPDVKKALWQMHRGKCCYCERKRDMKRESDVEHFRPKAEVMDSDHPGYWWLAYEWDNYFLSCKTCNQEHKKNHFPLIDLNSRARSPDDDWRQERSFFINPAEENPAHFISFVWEYGFPVKAIGIDDEGRGRETIRLIGLNEGTLPEERADLLKTLLNIAQIMYYAKVAANLTLIDETAGLIKERTSPETEFAGFQRTFFRTLGLGAYIYMEDD